MQTLKKIRLTSKTVSQLLIAALGLLIIGAALGSGFMQGALSTQVVETDHTVIDADLSQTELQRSKTLQTYLEENKDAVEKARTIVANTQTYQYQNQIMNDIEAFANKAGVGILGFSFPQDTATARPDATGIKSVTTTLTLKTPLDYTAYLRFLKYIEQNVTKMQITDLTLTPDPANGNIINGTSLTLKVYVR